MGNDPHAEGFQAHMDGLDESANPYDIETQEDDYLSWNDGWATFDCGDDE